MQLYSVHSRTTVTTPYSALRVPEEWVVSNGQLRSICHKWQQY